MKLNKKSFVLPFLIMGSFAIPLSAHAAAFSNQFPIPCRVVRGPYINTFEIIGYTIDANVHIVETTMGGENYDDKASANAALASLRAAGLCN